MAGHLLRAGHSVTVWNRTPSKAEPLRDQGAKVADSLADLAHTADVIFTCVGRTEDVEECVYALAEAAPGPRLIVDHSTIEPEGARRIAEKLSALGHQFVDAPVTGGSMGAQRGTLTIFCGGDEAAVEEAREFMVAYGKNIRRIGGSGDGQTAKLANQIAVGGATLALCESLAFAQRAGLDIAVVREMIAGGAGGSWSFENYGPKILNRDWAPGFSIKNQRKDFGYCFSAASAVGAFIPGTELVDQLLGVLEEEGRGEQTTVALFELYERGETTG